MRRPTNTESDTHVVFSRRAFSDAGSTPAASTSLGQSSGRQAGAAARPRPNRCWPSLQNQRAPLCVAVGSTPTSFRDVAGRSVMVTGAGGDIGSALAVASAQPVQRAWFCLIPPRPVCTRSTGIWKRPTRASQGRRWPEASPAGAFKIAHLQHGGGSSARQPPDQPVVQGVTSTGPAF